MANVVTDSRASIASDPLRNFRFRVIIYHTVSGYKFTELGFMTCSGLALETAVVAYREGHFNTTPQKMPGQTDFPPLNMARGAMVNTPHNLKWVEQIFSAIAGTGSWVPSKNTDSFRSPYADIQVLAHPWTANNAIPPKLLFRVFNVWPSAIAYSDLDAGGNAILMEQMTLQHEGWKVAYATDSYQSKPAFSSSYK